MSKPSEASKWVGAAMLLLVVLGSKVLEDLKHEPDPTNALERLARRIANAARRVRRGGQAGR